MTLNITDLTSALDGVVLEDQSVAQAGFVSRKLAMGKHPARLVSYMEVGDQKQSDYKGQPRDDAPTVILVFEFLKKDDITEATDDKPAYAMRKTVTLKKSNHEKSGYMKLFKKMRGGDSNITNMVQMVGTGSWLINVQWTQGKTVLTKKTLAEAEAKAKADPDNKELKIWNNIRNDEGFMITAPFIDVMDDEGEVIETKAIKVREPVGGLQVFLWDAPSPMFWESIFIEGSYSKTVNGKEEQVSKNRWQEMALGASNYEGSPLQAMLDGTDTLGDGAAVVDTPAEDDIPFEADAPKEDAPASEDEDLLADLGL